MKSSIDLTEHRDFSHVHESTNKKYSHKCLPWNTDMSPKKKAIIFEVKTDEDLAYFSEADDSFSAYKIPYLNPFTYYDGDEFTKSKDVNGIIDVHTDVLNFNGTRYKRKKLTYDKSYLIGMKHCNICKRSHRITPFISKDSYIDMNRLYDHDHTHKFRNHTSDVIDLFNTDISIGKHNTPYYFYRSTNGNTYSVKNYYKRHKIGTFRNCLEYYSKYGDDRKLKREKYVYYKGFNADVLNPRRAELFQPNGRVRQDYDALFNNINWREMLANRLGEVQKDTMGDIARRQRHFAFESDDYEIVGRDAWRNRTTETSFNLPRNNTIRYNIEGDFISTRTSTFIEYVIDESLRAVFR